MTYTYCCVYSARLLMMDRETVRNMYSSIPKINLRNLMITPCINNSQHFNFQLIHTMLKNVELLKYFKISETAPTCFGLQGNHHQCVRVYCTVYPHTVHGTHASQVTICSHNTDNVLYGLYVSTFTMD